jgi:putative ABC transport system substrate-binding protein
VSTRALVVAAKFATSTIPVVFVAADPMGQGLVESLARPDANLTGLASFSMDLAGKRLELLKDAFPRISRVAATTFSSRLAFGHYAVVPKETTVP